MKKFRVGVAGLGRGRKFVDIFMNLPGCEVTAVCDSAEQALARYSGLKTYTSYDKFMEAGFDIVAVITPGPLHAEQAVEAMEKGAHVLCETPCVYSCDEARSVVDAARRTGRKFMLAEDYIWMGWAVNMKQKAAEGAFGEIVYAEGDYTHDCRDLMLIGETGFVPYKERQRYPNARKSWRATDLPPLFYCSHTLGPLLHIMDDRVVSATGLSAGARTAPELCATDLEAGLFHTAKGSIIRLTNGFTVAHPYALYYNFVGTKGSAKIERGIANTFAWFSENADPPMPGWTNAPKEWQERPDGVKNHLEAMTAQFVNSIVNDTPAPLDVYRSLDFVLPGIVAHESALKGGIKLDVPDFR